MSLIKHGITAETAGNILLGAGTYFRGLKFEGNKWSGTPVGATSGGGKISIKGELLDLALDGALVKFKGQTVKQGGTATAEVNFAEITPDVIKMATLFKDGESDTVAVAGIATLAVAQAVSGTNAIKIATNNAVTKNMLVGKRVTISGQTGYIGANTSDTITLYEDASNTTPKNITCDAGALIYNADGGDLIPAMPAFSVFVDKATIDEGDYIANFGFVGYTADGSKQIIVIFEYAICTSGFEIEPKGKEQTVVKLTLEAVSELGGNLDTLPVKIYYPTAQ